MIYGDSSKKFDKRRTRYTEGVQYRTFKLAEVMMSSGNGRERSLAALDRINHGGLTQRDWAAYDMEPEVGAGAAFAPTGRRSAKDRTRVLGKEEMELEFLPLRIWREIDDPDFPCPICVHVDPRVLNAIALLPLISLLAYLRPTSAKIYLAMLAGKIAEDTTREEIAKASGVGKRSVSAAMKELKRHGLIFFYAKTGTGCDWYLTPKNGYDVEYVARIYRDANDKKILRLREQLEEAVEQRTDLDAKVSVYGKAYDERNKNR